MAARQWHPDFTLSSVSPEREGWERTDHQLLARAWQGNGAAYKAHPLKWWLSKYNRAGGVLRCPLPRRLLEHTQPA